MSADPYLVQYTDGSVEVRLPAHIAFRMREGLEVNTNRKYVELSSVLGIRLTWLQDMNNVYRLAASVMMYMGIAMTKENEAVIVQALNRIAAAGVQ